MADQSRSTGSATFEKGKGKAPDAHGDVEMGEDSEENDDEEEDEDFVSSYMKHLQPISNLFQ
jgi:hypothetical protein